MTPPNPATGRNLLRHPDFLKLWTAETISVFGSQITLLALPLVAATILNVTPLEFGLLGTIEFLPFILLSLPAGVGSIGYVDGRSSSSATLAAPPPSSRSRSHSPSTH